MYDKSIMSLFEEQREFAEERIQNGIEQHRKGVAKITVTDSEGNPVHNAKVSVKQKNHAFRFGANLFMLDELETEEKNKIYKERFAELFNMATLPFYWDATEPEQGKTRYDKNSEKVYRRPPIDLCIEYCEQNGIEPREHALAYDNFFPKWLYDASVFDVKKALEKRYREIAERYKDKIPTIEVTNEMEWVGGKTAFYNEPDFIEWSFKTAEKYFPANQLVINEHTPLCWIDMGRFTDKYYSYIEANMLKGARIDAIGMQFHAFFRAEEAYEKTRPLYNPENLYHHMDTYATFGKPLQVTEITIPAYSDQAEDEQMQAEILTWLYKIWFSHPNMEQIIYWNLVDGYAYVKNPNPETIRASQGDMTVGENYYRGGLLRFDMTPKPAFYALKKLFREEWHTEETLTTGENGKAEFKGFYGEYDVEIEIDGKITTHAVKLLPKRKNQFQIEL